VYEKAKRMNSSFDNVAKNYTMYQIIIDLMSALYYIQGVLYGIYQL